MWNKLVSFFYFLYHLPLLFDRIVYCYDVIVLAIRLRTAVQHEFSISYIENNDKNQDTTVFFYLSIEKYRSEMGSNHRPFD